MHTSGTGPGNTGFFKFYSFFPCETTEFALGKMPFNFGVTQPKIRRSFALKITKNLQFFFNILQCGAAPIGNAYTHFSSLDKKFSLEKFE